MRNGNMSEVRSSAAEPKLSAMGKSQTGATSRYENDAEGDNERDEREYDQASTMPKAGSGSFMVLDVCSKSIQIQIGFGFPARYRLHVS